ncbi:MAG: dihydroneopterin aldolase [Nitrospirales bacterium]|nr:dihydroneopterin aldolase [Nitrospirales bacterium]
MNKSTIVIKAIRLSVNCGVTEAERVRKQPLLVDIRFRCPNQTSFYSDKLSDTVDYGAIIRRVRETTEHKTFVLLERLTEQLCHILFQEFPLTYLELWVRKTQPPLEGLQGSVGIRVVRTRSQQSSGEASLPAEFLVAQLPRLPVGKVLDVAAGRGRHSLFLASNRFTVHAVDRDSDALSFLTTQARQKGLASLTTQILDMESDPSHPPDLGLESYEVVLVFFYLYRPLFPQLLQALKPGGVLLYETFLIDNHLLHQHPRRKEFCLGRNELLDLVRGLRVLHYEEGLHDASEGHGGAITARIVAQKPEE